ncbi:MAG TPA: hypothetical protein VMS11_09155 [Solirubrobacterales bacterium]|nr:hypothetical protein [Solirubrobacterales bacterium]
MRIAVPISIIALAAAVFAGCGGSSESDSTETGSGAAPQGGAATAPAGASAAKCDVNVAEVEAVRATGISCGETKAVLLAWQRNNGCVGSQGISHVACTVRSYRCIATRTERGVSVSCSKPGRSIAFTSKR